MPLPRILTLVFAGAVAVPVLSSLIGFVGWLPDAAGVIALLVAAAYVLLFVRKPVARWALAAGIVLLAGPSAVGRVFLGDGPAVLSVDNASSYVERQLDVDYAGALLLLAAAVAVTVGVVALPQFRRPVWQTALACVVALVPVAMAATDAAGMSDSLFIESASAALWWHLAPGLAATVLAGLALVLAVPRAERWFLLPVGVLLMQVTATEWTRAWAGAWTLARYFGAAETSSFFLQPGMRIEVPQGFVVDFDVSNALSMAVLFLGPALIAVGAARTAGVGLPAYPWSSAGGPTDREPGSAGQDPTGTAQDPTGSTARDRAESAAPDATAPGGAGPVGPGPDGLGGADDGSGKPQEL